MRRGSNLPAVGTYNQTLVLDLIRRAPEGVSRSELAARTGLSAQTLSNVARRLVDEGWVIEGTPVAAGPGKPRTPLRLDPSARCAVGIHLDPAVDTLVVVDLTGAVIAHTEHTPRQSGTAADLVADLAAAVDALLAASDLDRSRVLGIGVAAPGPLDAERGTLLEPPLLLPAWHNVPLRDRLHEATGLGTTVEKDVVAAMVGELWTDAQQELDDAIFFYYGAGVGAGLAVGGTPLRGRTGNAGDVAHLVVEEGGPLCGCGQRGCLGVAIAPERLLVDSGILAAGATPTAPELRAHLTELGTRIGRGDSRAVAAVDRAGENLARAVVQMNNLLDADVVVVGGPLWGSLVGAGATLERALAASPAMATVRGIRLLESTLGTDVAAVGAACLVLDSALTARPTDLMIASR
ncbi:MULTISPECIES: ROK family protein [unclassified Microbacterium]|uniref:ROK family transcriptional regulator n=1 Tax=unclassified Microbacterium TaxID=2609290 RepID=UPI00386CF2DC